MLFSENSGVQVMTRFLTSCPALYIYAAHVFESRQQRTWPAAVLLLYCTLWAWAGLVLFPNFHPWT